MRCPLSHALYNSVQSYRLDRDGLKWVLDIDGGHETKECSILNTKLCLLTESMLVVKRHHNWQTCSLSVFLSV